MIGRGVVEVVGHFSPAVSRGAGSEKWAVGYAFGGSIEANLVSSK